MKKVFLLIAMVLFGASTVGASPLLYDSAYEQKKGEDKKKDPPGPPVVRDKGKDEKPKDPPPKKKP